MRIIGGALRGRRLVGRAASATRPTSDRVREGIASALDARAGFDSAHVLDLYAGTGALGLEALSRGASLACAVECDRAALRCIAENIDALGLRDRTRVLALELSAVHDKALSRIEATGLAPFDLVFADPPYTLVQVAVTWLEKLAERGLLAPAALVVVEHAARSAPVRPECFSELALYRYGDSAVALWQAITSQS